jgi:nitroreductase
MKREEILNDLGWRYATKRFNREESINEKDYQAIKEAIRLAPTSYGLQPFKVIEIEDRETRTQLQVAGYGQKQIADASRLMAIASLKRFDNDLIDRYINLSMETRGLTPDEVSGYSNFMKGVFSQWTEEVKKSWSEKQAYLALGFGMLAAAELKIDTCALEGIDVQEVNKILQLEASDYHVSVLLALGKRAEEDENQHLKKVRLETSVLFETI